MISEPLRNPLSLFDVKGKVALITGASGAFGRGCALTLGALGAEVHTLVARPDSLGNAQTMLKAALDAYGRVDQLVVASGMNKAGFIQDLSYEDWQKVMDANVRGIWLMAKVVGTYWIENKMRGKVLLMSSVRGRHGNYSGYTGYCTSKGATDSLTRVLATDWAKYGITVNAIAPTVF